MVLSDKIAYRQIIGSLIQKPLLFLEYPDIYVSDFDNKVIKVCFMGIRRLYDSGATKLSVLEIDEEISKIDSAGTAIYKNGGGLDFLKTAYEFAQLDNFEIYYNRLKKYSLLRRLKKDNYDISEFYKDDKDIVDPQEELAIQEHFDNSTLEDILNAVESKYTIIRNEFLNGGLKKGDPAEGIFELIEELQRTPNIGPSLEGDIFSSACRGARQGCFYLKSAGSGTGKTRTAIFDACRIAYPIRWSHEEAVFIEELDSNGNRRPARKTLFIVTEMDKEELQTIMLAYLSGVNESHILTGKYEFGELTRVKYAAKIIEQYKDYFFIEEISDPNLVNVEATIKKYATIEGIKYCFFDYIHTTGSMLNQFSKNNVNEATILMMMSNQLKQLAKDYNIFISSATQVNVGAMTDDGEFKNETNIRGSKATADKADVGFVITRISEKTWNSIKPKLRASAQIGVINSQLIENPLFWPTHILDIYKMRRGMYKNVRIWSHIDLGNGRRQDLFMTTAENEPIEHQVMDIFSSAKEKAILDWAQERNIK